MKQPEVRLVKGLTPSNLFVSVQDAIREGYDLHTAPFLAMSGEICMFMALSYCNYEYMLITGNDLEDLNDKVLGVVALDYEFMFPAMVWNGMYLQWMQRGKAEGVSQKAEKETIGYFENTTIPLLNQNYRMMTNEQLEFEVKRITLELGSIEGTVLEKFLQEKDKLK